MGRSIKKLVIAFAVALTAACASGPEKPIRVDEMKDASSGLIYGQLRMPNEEWHQFRLVMIQRVGKVYGGLGLQALSERVQFTRDGRYIAANLAPGKYMLAGFVNGDQRNHLGQAALSYTVDVKPGGLHYMGTHNYVPTKSSNIFRPGEFSLQPDQSGAAHAQLLVWVEEATRETRWHAGVQKRLADTRKTVPAANRK